MAAVNVQRAKALPYALPLRRPLPGDRDGRRVREGRLLRVDAGERVTAEGRQGGRPSGAGGGAVSAVGDVAPLPGFSRESLAEARCALDAVAARIVGQGDWPDEPVALLRAAAAIVKTAPASVRFGVESALLNLWSAVHGRAWHRELGRPARATVAVNALVAGTPESMLADARAAVAAGYRCVKIKVGQLAVAEAVMVVTRIAGEAGGDVKLRVDASRAWSLAEAGVFAAGTAGCAVEYVEEPLRDPAEVAAFRRRYGVPVALDESLGEAAPPAADVWIVKPTLRGGIAATLALADAARDAGARVVISSAFESGVGLRTLVQLAAVVHDEGHAAGLGTGGWFARDVLLESLCVEQGVCDVARSVARPAELVPEVMS